MHIDFHHAVTYVCARHAGYGHDEAGVVAHAAQYVDDATNGGMVRFDNEAAYSRLSTSHPMVDIRNFIFSHARAVWLPFHFLPGNNQREVGAEHQGGFIHRLVCRPDSPVARDMLDAVMRYRDAHNALHLLGVAMHVYADTWAHQGFAGTKHRVNRAYLHLAEEDKRIRWGRVVLRLKAAIVRSLIPLGHGAALDYPDRPYLRWVYKDGLGRIVRRDNPADFLQAADRMTSFMRRFRTSGAAAAGLTLRQRDQLECLFREIVDSDCRRRHAEWLKVLQSGYFDFGPVRLSYIPKGVGSWKWVALGSALSNDCWARLTRRRYPWKNAFMTSDWKYFHDAAVTVQNIVVREVLPRYGIVAA